MTSRTVGSCFSADGMHKRAYARKEDARRAARQAQGRHGGSVLTPYRGDCGKWHLGHAAKPVEISASLTADLARRLSARAHRDGVPISEVVRQALSIYLEEHR